eukprot:CAMPEP_0206264314 /NCGR_PEP_ID=MMETSP0047_2-20121206/29327_1 /ASSEMBLY_ACC=CAM_ASM_000192 /TAXON_ID=195065 /ORGANISM="Chroomonas mesostigmatica_cf, Strain CCMP1168" /LENGTH=60 /DNA_ID=CAMNT_0053691997 /DNA_START=47 /DNA_END=226 /DNA_ORIENTATION=-
MVPLIVPLCCIVVERAPLGHSLYRQLNRKAHWKAKDMGRVGACAWLQAVWPDYLQQRTRI